MAGAGFNSSTAGLSWAQQLSWDISYFREDKRCVAESEENSVRANATDIKVSEEGGVGDAFGVRAGILLKPMEGFTVEWIFPCMLYGGSCQSRYPHCSP